MFCIKLLGNYHLQGLVLLVFYIKLSYWELPFAGSCFACVLHQAIGEVPFAGSCFACVYIKLSYWELGLVLLLFCIKLHLQGLVLLAGYWGITICRVLFCLCFASSYWGITICRVLFCLCFTSSQAIGNYHLQGLVLLVFCIKLLGKYHLQGLVLLVFYIKLSYWELPFAGSCFACVLHQASWGTTICKVWFRV